MINPPFPYDVIIRRNVTPTNPFEDAEESAVVVYDGVCDFESNRIPVTKGGVQVGKYKLYLPSNTTDVMPGDIVELTLLSRVIKGEVLDTFPTNFGLTITWDNTGN